MFHIELRINLRCTDARMTEKLLDYPQISSPLNQVHRISVPKGMRADLRRDSSISSVKVQDRISRLTTQFSPSGPHKDFSHSCFHKFGACICQIPLNPRRRVHRDWNPPGLTPLSCHPERCLVKFNFLNSQTHDLACPQPSPINKLHQSPITNSCRLTQIR